MPICACINPGRPREVSSRQNTLEFSPQDTLEVLKSIDKALEKSSEYRREPKFLRIVAVGEYVVQSVSPTDRAIRSISYFHVPDHEANSAQWSRVPAENLLRKAIQRQRPGFPKDLLVDARRLADDPLKPECASQLVHRALPTSEDGLSEHERSELKRVEHKRYLSFSGKVLQVYLPLLVDAFALAIRTAKVKLRQSQEILDAAKVLRWQDRMSGAPITEKEVLTEEQVLFAYCNLYGYKAANLDLRWEIESVNRHQKSSDSIRLADPWPDKTPPREAPRNEDREPPRLEPDEYDSEPPPHYGSLASESTSSRSEYTLNPASQSSSQSSDGAPSPRHTFKPRVRDEQWARINRTAAKQPPPPTAGAQTRRGTSRSHGDTPDRLRSSTNAGRGHPAADTYMSASGSQAASSRAVGSPRPSGPTSSGAGAGRGRVTDGVTNPRRPQPITEGVSSRAVGSQQLSGPTPPPTGAGRGPKQSHPHPSTRNLDTSKSERPPADRRTSDSSSQDTRILADPGDTGYARPPRPGTAARYSRLTIGQICEDDAKRRGRVSEWRSMS